jgi:hypothetical protein
MGMYSVYLVGYFIFKFLTIKELTIHRREIGECPPAGGDGVHPQQLNNYKTIS